MRVRGSGLQGNTFPLTLTLSPFAGREGIFEMASTMSESVGSSAGRAPPLLPVGLPHSRGSRSYSITLSARSMITSGILMPSALAVLRLMIVSNLIGCSMGKSPGFAPLNILSA